MNVLEKILQEIEHEAMTNKEIGRMQCEGMARAMNIVRSHMNEMNENCMDDELKRRINEMKEDGGYLCISDLIDRFVDVDKYYEHSPWNLRQIISNIYMLIPIKEEDFNNGWIPVEERLPKAKDEFVLVTVSGKYGGNLFFHNAVMIATYEGGTEWTIEGYEAWKNPNVTAWMPLPPKYEGE